MAYIIHRIDDRGEFRVEAGNYLDLLDLWELLTGERLPESADGRAERPDKSKLGDAASIAGAAATVASVVAP